MASKNAAAKKPKVEEQKKTDDDIAEKKTKVKESIREFNQLGATAARLTNRLNNLVVEMIISDPEWVWPIEDPDYTDFSFYLTSNSGASIEVTVSLDKYTFGPFPVYRRFSDLVEFCKALKAELQK